MTTQPSSTTPSPVGPYGRRTIATDVRDDLVAARRHGTEAVADQGMNLLASMRGVA